MMNGFLAFLMIVTAVFLILLVLIQRGRGGGLAGAFGGLGGQSAFGTKAGDLFTRITIGVAAFWIILCVVSVRIMGSATENKLGSDEDFDRSAQKGGAAIAPPAGAEKSSGKPEAEPAPGKGTAEGAKSNSMPSGGSAADTAKPSTQPDAAPAPAAAATDSQKKPVK